MDTKKYTLREAIEELQTIAASEVLEITESRLQDKFDTFNKTRAQQSLM